MPGDLDVAARLAAGRPSVEHVETYVWACRQLGYQHPELTTHPGQVRDWYTHEEGLDLHALEADRNALAAAATAADDAAARNAELAAELAGAWSGRGAGAAREFLEQHRRSALAVRDGLHRAADAIAAVRDELWRSVDAKVDAVLAIDDRRLAQRADWLAAAQTVTTGAGDRAAASELVDQQIKPFVANDIGSDWLAAMQRTVASVTAAYDAAATRMETGAAVTFDVPGELGPRWSGQEGSPVRWSGQEGSPAAVTAPASVPAAGAIQQPAVAAAPMPADPIPAAAPLPAPSPDPMPAAAAPPMPSLGELGGGMPAVGGSGFGQQLADLIGGLVGSSQDALPDPPEVDPPEVDDPEGGTEPADTAGESASDEDPDASDEDPDTPPEAEAEPEIEPEPPPAAVPVPEAPQPAPQIPPAAPEALPVERTPCEIAADELPQVGE